MVCPNRSKLYENQASSIHTREQIQLELILFQSLYNMFYLVDVTFLLYQLVKFESEGRDAEMDKIMESHSNEKEEAKKEKE